MLKFNQFINEGFGNILQKKENSTHVTTFTVWPGTKHEYKSNGPAYHRNEASAKRVVKSLKRKYGAGNVKIDMKAIDEEILAENVYKQMAAANKARIKAEKEKAKADVKSVKVDHAVAKKKHKEEIDHWTARVVEREVSKHYPDADGFDAVHRQMKKIGLHDGRLAYDHVSRVVRKHLGAKSFGDYVDKFHADHKRDNG